MRQGLAADRDLVAIAVGAVMQGQANMRRRQARPGCGVERRYIVGLGGGAQACCEQERKTKRSQPLTLPAWRPDPPSPRLRGEGNHRRYCSRATSKAAPK